MVRKVNQEERDQWATQVALDSLDQQVQLELQAQLDRVVQQEPLE